jgi:hypothetical protein
MATANNDNRRIRAGTRLMPREDYKLRACRSLRDFRSISRIDRAFALKSQEIRETSDRGSRDVDHVPVRADQ